MTWIEELIAEVERLRAQRVLSNEDFARSFDMGLAAGERRERAAVVAYLREQAEQWDQNGAGWAALNHAATMIERGLHRAGEGA
jgi:hypothetical protein